MSVANGISKKFINNRSEASVFLLRKNLFTKTI